MWREFFDEIGGDAERIAAPSKQGKQWLTLMTASQKPI
jgi:hypothetical protein